MSPRPAPGSPPDLSFASAGGANLLLTALAGRRVPEDGVDVAALHEAARRQRREREAQLNPTESLARAYRAFCLWRGTPEGIEEVDPVREITDVVDELADRLESQGVPYVIGGAFALAIHGTPRFTYNLDIMVLTELEQARAALADPRYEELSPVSYREATTDLLVDLHPVQDGAQRWAAQQAETVELFDRQVNVLSPEGLALMLLREATQGEQEIASLRLRDVELLANQPGLDWAVLAQQAASFSYEQAYRRLDVEGKPEV